MSTDPAHPLRILIIRRDNIGDLVCTTPLIRSLRQQFPQARIDALVNSYNLAVVADNPDLDHVYAYTKGKHRDHSQSGAGIYLQRLAMYWALFRCRYDYIVLADTVFSGRALSMARWFRPAHIIGFAPAGQSPKGLDLPIRSGPDGHVVARLAALLTPLGINTPPPALVLQANPAALAAARSTVGPLPAGRPLIGLHISARKPSQRWPAERFIELAKRLHTEHGATLLLFWSPGAEDNPLHPGDDQKAHAIIEGTAGLPLQPFATRELAQLIAGLSLVEWVICSDGGAMHIAAGLGKPVVCFFGQSNVTHWHPWGVPYVALQPASQQVTDVSVDEVMAACHRLAAGRT